MVGQKLPNGFGRAAEPVLVVLGHLNGLIGGRCDESASAAERYNAGNDEDFGYE